MYFSWLEKYYPDAYKEFNKMPTGGMFYDATYKFVGEELKRITGEKILLSGDGYSFHYRGKRFEDPGALIRYSNRLLYGKSLKGNPSNPPAGLQVLPGVLIAAGLGLVGYSIYKGMKG